LGEYLILRAKTEYSIPLFRAQIERNGLINQFRFIWLFLWKSKLRSMPKYGLSMAISEKGCNPVRE